MSKIFEKYLLGNVELSNRLVLSPMCMYSAKEGLLNEFHHTHYLTRAIGGVGLIILEATAVCPEGRISPEDLGIWNDQQAYELSKLVKSIRKTESKIVIQLAHAGRKASNRDGKQLDKTNGAWECMAPSAIPFLETEIAPKAMTLQEIHDCVLDFKNATRRAVQAGFDGVEIHAAHGYLVHQFLSPFSNFRTDHYGGSLENRFRFLIEIIDAVKLELTEKQALMIRISATDYIPNAWDLEQSIALAKVLKNKGVHLIDVSSGGNVPKAPIAVKPLYQVGFAAEIKKQAHIPTGAVGLITTLEEIEGILENQQADLVFMARELLRNPYFPMQCAFATDTPIYLPATSYLRAKPYKK